MLGYLSSVTSKKRLISRYNIFEVFKLIFNPRPCRHIKLDEHVLLLVVPSGVVQIVLCFGVDFLCCLQLSVS